MRLEARIKMGYYPTPLSVIDRARYFLLFPEDNVNFLDPCCGEGLALKNLVKGHEAGTYGIELDGYRAEEAKANLDHVLKGSYEDARISNAAFSCLFLNPPYDWDTSGEPNGERKEKAFLRGTVKYLQPEGVLIYIVPQKNVSRDVAKILSYRFEDFNVFRFPDEEYQQYKQIVVFGAKKQENYLNGRKFDRLRNIPNETLEEIPYPQKPVYELPSSKPMNLFRSSVIDEAELEKELKKSVLWEKLKGYRRQSQKNVERPPLPLHTGHLGLLLASGCLDGIVGEGRDRHIVRGKVEKVSYKQDEYQGDVLIEKETETHRVSIKILKKDGEIITLV
jgi:hypothetical protein